MKTEKQLYVIWLLFCQSTVTLATKLATEPYLGTGYNLLQGNPDGKNFQTFGQDPGLRITRKIFRTLYNGSTYIIDIQYPHCRDVSSNTVIYDVKSYQQYLFQFISFTEHAYREMKQRIETDHKFFRNNVTSCVSEHARISSPYGSYKVTNDFAHAVCILPTKYDQAVYDNFLDTWGTHIIMELETGHKDIQRFAVKQTDIAEIMLTSRDMHLNGAASVKEEMYGGYGSVVVLNMSSLHQSDLSNLPDGNLLSAYNYGSRTNMEPVKFVLTSLLKSLSDDYWRDLEFNKLGCDSLEADMPNIKANLEKAISLYPFKHAGEKPVAAEIKLPLVWPSGTYGLSEPKSGCPNKNVIFRNGTMVQISARNKNGNAWSSDIHLAGDFNHFSITTKYCIKESQAKANIYKRDWPIGNYCIYKKGNCASGFQTGQIFFDDDSELDPNSGRLDVHIGSLPDGTYSDNTLVHFCCRQDGPHTTPILLPIDQPFYLLRYTSECQVVLGMNVTDEFILYDTEDYSHDDSSCTGAHQYTSNGCKDPKLHYCYYHRDDHHKSTNVNVIFGK